MKKNLDLNRWFWKQHIVAGLIVLPLMLLLSISGTIYLFKDNYEAAVYRDIRQVTPSGPVLSYEAQRQIAQAAAGVPLTRLVLPSEDDRATEFVAGQRAAKRTFYVHPTQGQVTGTVVQAETLMHKVRKLHGELLLGKAGTLVVELGASWLFVLLITGLYVWWPARRWSVAGFFTVRRHRGRRLFYRDLHAVLGFWCSLFLLLILAGGMPWTDVFGAQYKRLQELTNTGYPDTYRGKGVKSRGSGIPLSLDQMVAIAEQQQLKGTVSVGLPRSPQSVFTVSNRARYLRDQWVIHFDQYSGEKILAHPWRDVGLMMNLRQVMMRLHEGQYGLWNWLLLLLAAGVLSVSIVAGGISYFMRKPKGRWGLPAVPQRFVVGPVLLLIILILAVVFPLLGASLLLLWLGDRFLFRKKAGGSPG